MTETLSQLRTSMTADRIGGLIWLIFGAALTYGSWTMDRLESQGVSAVTAPGLVPGLLGIGIIAFSLVLVFRRRPARVVGYSGEATAPDGAEAAGSAQPDDWRRLILSWVLCMTFAGVLLGRGLPFWLLAGGFVFLHIVVLEDPERVAARPLPQRLLIAALIATATAAIVSFVFQQIFLIRLP